MRLRPKLTLSLLGDAKPKAVVRLPALNVRGREANGRRHLPQQVAALYLEPRAQRKKPSPQARATANRMARPLQTIRRRIRWLCG